jgi:hypothetical protein
MSGNVFLADSASPSKCHTPLEDFSYGIGDGGTSGRMGGTG